MPATWRAASGIWSRAARRRTTAATTESLRKAVSWASRQGRRVLAGAASGHAPLAGLSPCGVRARRGIFRNAIHGPGGEGAARTPRRGRDTRDVRSRGHGGAVGRQLLADQDRPAGADAGCVQRTPLPAGVRDAVRPAAPARPDITSARP